MSLAINPVSTYTVLDPVTDIDSKREYIVLKGGSRVTYKSINSTSYSETSIQFTAPPPSPGVIVSRKIMMKLPVTITFVGDSGDAGQGLLQSGYDAFRAFPISSVMNTMTVSINNTSMSINMSDVIQPLLRYNTGLHIKDRDYSTTPSMMDTYARYESGTNTIRNPLGGYGDAFESARGGFKVTVVSNTQFEAVVQADLTELLYLSPFVFGRFNKAGLIGVQNMDFNFTFGNDLSRMWSHASGASTTFTSATVAFSQPSLLFKYVTPSQIQPIPRSAVYPYFSVNRYPTDSNLSFTPGQTRTLSTQNIQLQSIPRRLYIFARRKNSDQTVNTTDTFFGIQNISVNWNNYSGLLSSASQQDLYKISIKNGCNMTFSQWSGGPTTTMSGLDIDEVGTVGSVLCLEMGTDIALNEVEAPGQLGTYQLQMDISVQNINLTDTITPSLYVVVVSEGTFTIQNNNAIAQIGVLSKNDVLNSAKSGQISYNMIKDAYGGDFLSGMKEFGKKALKGIRQVGKVVGPAAKAALPIIIKNLPKLLKLLPLIGLGAGGQQLPAGYGAPPVGGRKRRKKAGRPKKKRGGILAGGQVMSRAELRRRLM